MKTNLKGKINYMITSYQEVNKEHEQRFLAALNALNAPDVLKRYTSVGLREKALEAISEITTEMESVHSVLNQKAVAIVEDTKQEFMTAIRKSVGKSPEYSIAINNALQFLQAEDGDSLTDDVAFSILEPFAKDYDQMKLFKRMVEKKTGALEDAFGNNPYVKTFGWFNNIERILNSFSEIGQLVSTMFVNPKSTGVSADVQNHTYYLPSDSYTEIANWDSVLQFAEDIDNCAAAIES